MGDRGPVHTSSSARPCWERWKTGLDGRSARTSRAAAPATHTMTDWQVQASPTRVDVWCERRLQFNSKPETVALRTAIGDAVAQLQAAPGQILSATFTSAGTDLVDAENVLVYNVGAARFKAASREGIRFERVHASPERASHHHRYELVDRDSTSHHWRRLETLVRCSVPITRIDDQSKPDSVWQAVRREAGTATLDSGLYGLQVTLSTPRPVRLASLIKPLLDGLISGLHYFEGADLDLVSSRLAKRLGQSRELRTTIANRQGTRLLPTTGKSSPKPPGPTHRSLARTRHLLPKTGSAICLRLEYARTGARLVASALMARNEDWRRALWRRLFDRLRPENEKSGANS